MRLVGMFFRVYVRSGDPTTPVCSWRKTEVFFSETKNEKSFFFHSRLCRVLQLHVVSH